MVTLPYQDLKEEVKKLSPGDNLYHDSQSYTFIGKSVNQGGLGLDIYFFFQKTEAKAISYGTLDNSENPEKANFQVHLTEGSELGFSETVGISATGGVNIPFVASGEVTISGEISFSQAFSSSVSQIISTDVESGDKVEAFEAQLMIQYYSVLINTLIPSFPAEIVPYGKEDKIGTGILKLKKIN